jgi:hypothetical protein
VLLNVYIPRQEDGKQQMSMPGFGVYHTGTEVYGTEYMFAGGESTSSGIHTQQPRASPPGSTWQYEKTVQIGVTTMSRSEIQTLISRMGSDFPGNTYHLMAKNCNHFSHDFCKRITKGSSGIPSWVNRTANWGNTLFGPGGSAVGAGAGAAAGPAEQPKVNVFASSPGYRLDGSAAAAAPSSSSSGKKAAAARPASASVKSPNAAGGAGAGAGAGGGSGGAAGRKNPWRDPHFMPGQQKVSRSPEPEVEQKASVGVTAGA